MGVLIAHLEDVLVGPGAWLLLGGQCVASIAWTTVILGWLMFVGKSFSIFKVFIQGGICEALLFCHHPHQRLFDSL